MTLIKKTFPSWPAFTDFFDDDWLKLPFREDWGMPAVNVIENEGTYEIEVLAPGFKKEDFNVTLDNRMLYIKGKWEKEEEEKEKNFTRREFNMKSFSKSFTLPENVDEEEIEAKYEDGILLLMLTKTEKVLPPKKEVVIE